MTTPQVLSSATDTPVTLAALAQTDPLTLSALLARQAAVFPDRVAFIDEGREITYAKFAVLCDRTAAWLAGRGIVAGDKVAVWLVNRVEWLALYFGLARLGAALVTVNTRYRSHELEHILEQSKARMLVLQLNFRKIDFPAILRDVRLEAAASLEQVVVIDQDADTPHEILGKPVTGFYLADLPDVSVPDQSSADALSILFTTSGTTSKPKLVMHLQRTVGLHVQRAGQSYGFMQPGTVLLAALPFGGTFGFMAAFAAFVSGASVVIMDTFDGPAAAQLCTRYEVTHVFGSDEMFGRIIENGVGDVPFPSARVFGFACFHPGLSEFGESSWKRGIPITGLYGSSEVHALFSLQPAALPQAQRIEGGGKPASADAEIRIRDIETGALLPPGVTGEIEIRSPTNFVGYLNNPEATAKAIDSEGFFHTGDVGQLREDGTFVYQTRLGDAIRLGGYLVSPAEIEDVLKNMAGVADVQVVAVEIGSQTRSVAFVVAAPDAALEPGILIAAAAASLASFKVPARIWLVDEFPTTQSANGIKVQRAKLRDMAIDLLNRSGSNASAAV